MQCPVVGRLALALPRQSLTPPRQPRKKTAAAREEPPRRPARPDAPVAASGNESADAVALDVLCLDIMHVLTCRTSSDAGYAWGLFNLRRRAAIEGAGRERV